MAIVTIQVRCSTRGVYVASMYVGIKARPRDLAITAESATGALDAALAVYRRVPGVVVASLVDNTLGQLTATNRRAMERAARKAGAR